MTRRRCAGSGRAGLSLALVGLAIGFPGVLRAQDFQLTEFSAANQSGLRDEDGDSSDWIEIHNAGQDQASIGGWYLSDDPLVPSRWQFPEVVIPGQGFLVVFASGKDRTHPAGELHTNFQLSRDGEFLGLYRPDGATPATHFWPQYPRQVPDVSYGVRMDLAKREYIAADAEARWHVPADGQLGLNWIEADFSDGTWESGRLAIGYDRGGGSTEPSPNPTYPVEDITQPGDVIVPTSGHSPAGEGVANVIDGSVGTKYLNFDEENAGFTVTPSVGPSVVTGLRFTSANDAPNRDPTSFALWGSNDGLDFGLVAQGPIPEFVARFETVAVAIGPAQPFLHYRLLFPTIRDSGASAMQIAEVEFAGLILDSDLDPVAADVTLPGDPVDATSSNSPANEGVANAIDNDPETKYLNFDKLDTGLTITPSAGESVVTGLRLTSANDAPDRDPTSFELSGSMDGHNFTRVAEGPIPEFSWRFETVEIAFTNDVAYSHYRLLFPTVRDAGAAAAMQIAEIELVGRVGPSLPSLQELIGTDLDASMFGQHDSAYVRVPFQVDPSDSVGALALYVRHDDGFVAYLNGVEVARGNAPEAPAFDSTARSDRPLTASLAWERHSLASVADLVQPGANLLAVHALNHRADSPEFLLQVRLENAQLVLGEPGYFADISPGGLNATLHPGLVEDPAPDHAHGFYEAPFSVALSSPTPQATLRYTTDGSAPTATTGERYLGPIPVDRTTVLRAAAFRDQWLPSRVVTVTYLFVDDIVAQDHAATLAAGFPATWNGQAADYGLDPRVVGAAGQDDYGGAYAAELRESLLSLPSMSIVMNVDDMFGPEGIYANPENRGDRWEREVSLELIHPGDAEGFQRDAGIRIQGGAFRRFDLSLKKSFRIAFRGEYGATTLQYPLFGPDAADEFDNFILRANSNDAWRWGGDNALYIRDAFAQETLRAMGGVAPHSRFVHLYINGFYWGLYNPVERPDAAFSASYLGGDPDTWDGLNQDSAPDGDYAAWNRLLTLLNGDVSSPELYQRIQGNHPDGTRNPAYEDLLDVDNMIDYMILNLYVGNVDWPHRNYWVGRDRNDGDGFKFYPWDTETALGLGSGVTTDRTGVSGSVAQPYAALRANADFRQRFGDRVHRHFSNGGALYVDAETPYWNPAHPEDNQPAARFAGLAATIDHAMVAESGRWGDQLNTSPYTRDEHWRAERDELLDDYLPRRSGNVLVQLRNAGLYPRVDPPGFNQQGGSVADGFALTMTSTGGTIYFTTDGTDPRTSLNPGSVQAYTDPIVLRDLAIINARVYDGEEWSALNQATFVIGHPRLVLTELNYHPHDPTAAEVQAGFVNDDDFEFLEFYNAGSATFDLHGVHFTDGIEFDFTGSAVTRLPAGQSVLVVRNRDAFAMRYGSGHPVAGEHAGGLSNSGERIALGDASGTTILEITYGTAAPWPAAADGTGLTLEKRDLEGPIDTAGSWQLSPAIGGSPGAVSLEVPVVISSIDRTESGIMVMFDSLPGHTYMLYARDVLNTGAWEAVDTYPGDFPDVRIDFGGETPHRFFRLIDVQAGP